MDNLKLLQPTLLWQHFSHFCMIPRPSKKEKAVIDFYENYAKTKGYDFYRDAIGNLIIRKPATKGYENSPKIILQGHVDMVAQKTIDSQHDFLKDSIKPFVKDGWVYATETTLGADNAIGVAAALAILDDQDAIHGDLEVLMTVDEEAGMGGARALSNDCLQGQYLLNLDTEQWGECCVGCAGGADIQVEKEVEYQTEFLDEFIAYRLSVSGLRGGHSGIDIHTGRASANAVLIEVLHEIPMDFQLIHLEGGTLRNAIARDAFAEILISKKEQSQLQETLASLQIRLKRRLKIVDENIQLKAAELESFTAQQALSLRQTQKIIAALHLLPHGVLRQSVEVKGVVETSCNFGVLRLNPKQGLSVQLMARSLISHGLNDVFSKVRAASQLADLQTKMMNEYPAWEPKMDSPALSVLLKAYQEMTGEEMNVSVIHAGLETGIIGSKYPNLEMISFGPTITGAHSPDEGVDILSVEKFYDLLKKVLAKFAGQKALG